MLSKRAAIVVILIALALGLYAGRFLLASHPSQVGSVPAGASDGQTRDDAAAAASRAMTFTQPKASTK